MRQRQRKDPCHGCGRPAYGIKEGAVCEDCRRVLDDAKRRAEDAKEGGAVLVQLREAAHWYPGFYYSGGFCNGAMDQVRDTLHRAFFDLGEALAVKVRGEDFTEAEIERSQDGGILPLYHQPRVELPKKKGQRFAEIAQYPCSRIEGSARVYGRVDGKLLEIIRTLWDHTARFAEMSYLHGKRDGQNLLLQLSSGGMSLRDLEEREMELAARVQNAEYLQKKLGRPAKKRGRR